MIIKIEELLQRQMTRKQFLQAMGMAILSLVGVSSLLGAMSHSDLQSGGKPGYGLRDYGP